jgi:amino acid adenylation domain-containing protein
LELPLDHPRPPQPSYRGEVYSFELSKDSSRQVKQLAGQHKSTLFMVMAAAFSALLYRYAGSRDFCIGYPVAGRNRSQVAGLIGFFVNTLVLRCRVDGEISFADWLALLREQALQDQNHQELAFGQLLDALNPHRNPSHAPLFQVMLAVQNVPAADFRMGNLNVSSLTLNNGATQFDLTLFVDEQDGYLTCSFEYAKDLFSIETIERMAVHLRTLLERATVEPKQSLWQLTALPAEQYRLVVDEFNATECDYRSQPGLVHALIETQAAKTPNAVALRFEAECLSYAELNAKANRLAHELIGLGVGPEVLVGVCLVRSLEMVVALLAILKAGGAYVPLDPDYPAERLRFMLTDSEPKLLISRQNLCGAWSEQAVSGVRTLLLDDAVTAAGVALRSDANPDSVAMGLAPANLAYAIYTSGSTGQPKGAMNQHDAVVNRLLWAQDQYRLTAGDKVMQKTPFSFDVSVWEFFLPLLAGAELVLARPKGHQEPDYLQDLIETVGVTILHFVPSMLQAFLSGLDAEKCRSLRQVLCSGEALSAALTARFHEVLPNVALHNLYGPTEAAVDVTAWPCQPDDSASPPPIGRPIANTRLYILDTVLQPVPLGVIGEIYIGGIAVGRGYCRKPDLSAERFLPDPFAAGDRLYKTGDLGRWRADGGIDYIGRNDFQVKLRGFRIELGEIESRLAACDGVGQAVVVARGDRLGDKRLVAYLTSRSCGELSLGELRQHLAADLPDYMLPAAFVVLPSLPLNANGKLDRSALPAPDTETLLGREYQAPQGEAEAVLADIWQDLLELECVGRNDHFFELGGHSLLALTMADRLRQRGWNLSAREVFARPLLADLAAVIDDDEANDWIPANLISDPFPLSANTPMEEFRL